MASRSCESLQVRFHEPLRPLESRNLEASTSAVGLIGFTIERLSRSRLWESIILYYSSCGMPTRILDYRVYIGIIGDILG